MVDHRSSFRRCLESTGGQWYVKRHVKARGRLLGGYVTGLLYPARLERGRRPTPSLQERLAMQHSQGSRQSRDNFCQYRSLMNPNRRLPMLLASKDSTTASLLWHHLSRTTPPLFRHQELIPSSLLTCGEPRLVSLTRRRTCSRQCVKFCEPYIMSSYYGRVIRFTRASTFDSNHLCPRYQFPHVGAHPTDRHVGNRWGAYRPFLTLFLTNLICSSKSLVQCQRVWSRLLRMLTQPRVGSIGM
jgi:hypothetical protein